MPFFKKMMKKPIAFSKNYCIIPDFRSKMKKMVLNHLIKHHFYLL